MTAVAAGTQASFPAGLQPLDPPRRRLAQILSPAASLGMLALVLLQVRTATAGDLAAALPSSPAFIPLLVALYLALPLADWVIFRRLWRLPLEGLPVILVKRVGNELLAYSGEVYFYLWARRRTGLTAAPFGTIKDVNILSALVGNLVTLLLLLLTFQLFTELATGRYAGPALASSAVMMAGSLLTFLFRRRLFTLPRHLLAWVAGVHTLRLAAGVTLSALLWHSALPAVSLGLWLALATLRLLVSRLPLVPNKELLFGVIAVFLLGQENALVALIGVTAAGLTLLHLLFGTAAILCLAWTAGGQEDGKAGRHAGEPPAALGEGVR